MNDYQEDQGDRRNISPIEFYRAVDDLRRNLDTGFSGLNVRLDTLNGRTRKVESQVAEQWRLWKITGAVGLVALAALLGALAAYIF